MEPMYRTIESTINLVIHKTRCVVIRQLDVRNIIVAILEIMAKNRLERGAGMKTKATRIKAKARLKATDNEGNKSNIKVAAKT